MSIDAAVLGAGFIGKNFVRYALKKGYALSVLDHQPCPEEFDGRLKWIQGEMGRKEDLVRVLENAKTVFHFISSTVPGDIIDESVELQQNVFQTLQLLGLCVEKKIRRIVFTSSSSVYGIQNDLPILESATTSPISSHGIHKLTIEKYMELYQQQHGLDCKIVRLSNPFGPGQSIHGRQGFIAIALGRITSGKAMEIRGDGGTIRDFIYIDDVVQALDAMMQTRSHERVFNIGSGIGHSLNEVVDLLSRLTGIAIPVDYSPTRLVDIPISVLDIQKSWQILGFSPKISLESGLEKTLMFHNIPFIKKQRNKEKKKDLM